MLFASAHLRNSAGWSPLHKAGRGGDGPKPVTRACAGAFLTQHILPQSFTGLFLLAFTGVFPLFWASPAFGVGGRYGPMAFTNFLNSHTRYLQQATNADALWQFARACFDVGEYATNSAERAAFAQQGIDVSRKLIARQPNSAEGHYYLGLNLGQLARTRTLGALKLVKEMEREFLTSRKLNHRLDYAGPDRTLGYLYRDAPSFGSVGDRSKARTHLEQAIREEPDYPDQRLALIEAFLSWNEPDEAQRSLKGLDAVWPRARASLTGPTWAASWEDWQGRLLQIRKTIGASSRVSGD
jgi:tetratricopeptide (TPR) repeat protein